MTDKQIKIDYKKLCENYSKEVGCFGTFDGSCIKEQCFTYKLLQQLKAKEQECKELKEQLKEMNEVIRTETTRCSLVNILKIELDQLKAENDELKKKCNIYTCGICGNKEDCNKLYKTLTEIKEISERCGKRIPLFEVDEIAGDL